METCRNQKTRNTKSRTNHHPSSSQQQYHLVAKTDTKQSATWCSPLSLHNSKPKTTDAATRALQLAQNSSLWYNMFLISTNFPLLIHKGNLQIHFLPYRVPGPFSLSRMSQSNYTILPMKRDTTAHAQSDTLQLMQTSSYNFFTPILRGFQSTSFSYLREYMQWNDILCFVPVSCDLKQGVYDAYTNNSIIVQKIITTLSKFG